MSYDDPEYLECTCHHRALKKDEMVEYFVPVPAENKWNRIVFARDCPIHGVIIKDAVDASEPVD